MAYSATAVAAWDNTKPDGAAEAVNVADDAIREIKTCVENDLRTAAQVTAAALAAAVGAVPGLVIRPKFSWKDADEIYIEPFVNYHKGTSEQLLYCDLKLTYQFQNLAASDISYLYLDDSAIVSAGSALISNSELIDSLSVPIWSVSKHGWYSGEDKCIGGFKTDGSSQLTLFVHDGGDYFGYQDHVSDRAEADLDTTWTTVTLSIPKFATKAICTFISYAVIDAETLLYYRTYGDGGAGVLVNTSPGIAEGHSYNSEPVFTDGSQRINVKNSLSNVNQVQVLTKGYYFPAGM